MKKLLLSLALAASAFTFAEERTLSIIKPDAVEDSNIGAIVDRFEQNGLKVVAMKMTTLSEEEARAFYSVHEGKPFFDGLVEFMTSGPVVVQVLEGDNAVSENRRIMGATNPAEAVEGSIRKDFAKSISQNAVHGSDCLENAEKEILFFFPSMA